MAHEEELRLARRRSDRALPQKSRLRRRTAPDPSDAFVSISLLSGCHTSKEDLVRTLPPLLETSFANLSLIARGNMRLLPSSSALRVEAACCDEVPPLIARPGDTWCRRPGDDHPPVLCAVAGALRQTHTAPTHGLHTSSHAHLHARPRVRQHPRLSQGSPHAAQRSPLDRNTKPVPPHTQEH